MKKKKNLEIKKLENLKMERFSKQMLIELDHNQHKESILTWDDFDNMITELEYHKSKMFMAIRVKNKSAIKEYIADCANILFGIGNYFELYEESSIDDGMAHEIIKDYEFIKKIKVENSSKNQILA